MLINFSRVLKQTALRHWDQPALFNVERSRRFTFGQLHEFSNRVCNLLAGKFGLGLGDRYATILENDNAALLHMWMMKSPVTAVWLGIRESGQEHLEQIDRVEARLVFIEQRLLEEYYEDLHQRQVAMVVMDPSKEPLPGVYDFWELVEQASDQDPELDQVYENHREHIALMRFTGGTTGQTKCAMYTISNLCSAAWNPINYMEVIPFDQPKYLVTTPITHAAGAVVLPTYFKGGEVITLDRADIEPMCSTVQQFGANLIYTVPTLLYRMLDMELLRKYDLSSLKTIRYGASPISPAKLEGLLGQFGQIFVQGYGATEAWSPTTILGRKDHALDTEEQRALLASVGSPVPGVEVMICDENGTEVPAEKAGEIWIRGGNTIAGYYNDPEQTGLNFSDNGFWKSGDIGYSNSRGYIYLVDRKKDMIISGGFNVYAQEVENVLNSYPAVQNSAVVGVPHEDWGEAVWGVVVLKEDAQCGQDEIITYCKENLTRYKVPKVIKFVTDLPLSAAGKVLRREVKKKYWEKMKRNIH